MTAPDNTDRPAISNCCTGYFVTVINQVKNVARNARARARLRSEFAHLDNSGQLDPMLKDFGFDRAQLPTIVENHPVALRRLAAMLRRLGIKPTAEQQRSAEMREIQRTCLLCGAGGKCDHWLSSGAPGEERQFCPNAEALDRLRGKSA